MKRGLQKQVAQQGAPRRLRADEREALYADMPDILRYWPTGISPESVVVLPSEPRIGPAFGMQAKLCRISACCARRWLAQLCGGVMTAHHEPPRSEGGLDPDTLPLCRRHHDIRHALGPAVFWQRVGVNPQIEIAKMRAMATRRRVALGIARAS